MRLLLALIVAWSSSGATVSWQQPADFHGTTCLLRYYGATYPAAICWRDLPAGPQTIALPGALSHPAYVPRDGDRYELHFDGAVVAQAALGEARVYRVYLGAVQTNAAPRWETRLPALRA